MTLILNLIETALTVYTFVIVARFLLTWVPLRSGTPLYRVYSVLYDVTEPYLRLFRRFLPPVRLGNAAIDLAPIAGMVLLIVLSMLVAAL